MSSAAAAPVGNAPATWQMVSEFFVILIIPLFIPNIAFLMIRGQVSLADLCFGFVAISMAVTTKALSVKTVAWNAVTLAALALTIIFVALAVGTDPWREAQTLVDITSTDAPGVVQRAMQIAEANANLSHSAPTVGHWISAIAMGLLLVAPTGFLIWKRDA